MTSSAPASVAGPACRLCGQPDREPFLSLPHSPANISRLLRPEEFDRDRPVDLQIWRCRACGFVQLDPTFAETFYDDYLMTVSHSALMQRYQREQAMDFVDRHGLRAKRVVEVGCGDGNYLEHLRAAGAEVIGNEPSARFRELAVNRGFQVQAGYVHRHAPVPGGPYDGFATRQVLEHVPDPREFLLGIRASLKPDGVGLVEVPSLEQALAGHRFYDFFADHLNYFSAPTLRLALELAGFQVLETSRGMNGEFNVAIVRVAEALGFGDFDTKLHDLLGALRSWIEGHQKAGRRVAVWGAGGKGLSSMAVARLQGIAYVIDSDPHKQGRFTPVGHFPIVPPERLRDDPVDAVVLTALAYRDEIVADLRGRLGFRGPIAAMGTRLETL
ncbi:MAG: methyltransferase domain-containing protein [Verrucomicrobiales bacterium]|nr:methyltransferase domain-containing protein [Verrucomicrobiales bacterium]